MNASTPSRLGVVVSGGAPTVHLAAGALCAFYEKAPKFDVVATAGAGALPGLMYVAPKGGDPQKALRNSVNLNIHNALYQLIPSNFKVFHKYGPFSKLFWQLGHLIPHFPLPPEERLSNSAKRLYNDWIDLVTAAITPTTLNYRSKSVLTRVQVIDDLVDWAGLRNYSGEFFLNSFSLKDRTLKVFDKTMLSPEAFYAALAMPWLYVPTEYQGTLYTEGASHDPGGLLAVFKNKQPTLDKLDAIVFLDTIGPELWTDPESIYEAMQLTIMDPIVTLLENFCGLFAFEEFVYDQLKMPMLPKVYRLPFDVSSWERGKLLEWSYENALTLWETGYEAALEFCNDLIPDSNAATRAQAVAQSRPAEKYRYLRNLKPESREGDFFKLFDIHLPAGPGGP